MRGLIDPPSGPWAPTWIVGLLLAGTVLGWVEYTVRGMGHEPGMGSQTALWCHHRQRLESGGPEQVVVIGGSRLQMGFSLPAFREELPDLDPIQLAMAGTCPAATLHDLAEDESFNGTVLCSGNARMFQPTHLRDQTHLIEHYHETWGPGEDLGLIMAAPFQLNLALLQPHLSAPLVVPMLLRGKRPGPNYVTTRFDRTRVADYTKINLERVINARMEILKAEFRRTVPTSPEQWRKIIGKVHDDVRRIEERGGRVVFLHLPTRGRYAELEDNFHPREVFWDVFREHVGALTLDSSEMPDHESLILSDESHLDYKSGERYTRWIARELVARGVVSAP